MRISDWSSDVCSSDLQNRLAVGAVFGLGQQVGSYEVRPAAFVGNDQDFRRAGGHINGYPVSGMGHHLGTGYVLVARSEQFADFRHGPGAERHGCDGLGASGEINFFYPQYFGNIRNMRTQLACPVWRAAAHAVPATGKDTQSAMRGK